MKLTAYKGRRPFKFKFMGREYSILYTSEIPEDSLGMTHHDSARVLIREGQSPIEEADTVVHECFHILWHLMGMTADLDDALEERVVRTISTAWVAAIKENPAILEYLKHATKESQ